VIARETIFAILHIPGFFFWSTDGVTENPKPVPEWVKKTEERRSRLMSKLGFIFTLTALALCKYPAVSAQELTK
jgi:hypothetical protein